MHAVSASTRAWLSIQAESTNGRARMIEFDAPREYRPPGCRHDPGG
jgi:hypothetical protein